MMIEWLMMKMTWRIERETSQEEAMQDVTHDAIRHHEKSSRHHLLLSPAQKQDHAA